MEPLLQDIRYAIRVLARAPGLTAAAMAALALGIGANTAIFSLVNAVLLRQLPFRDSGRLVWLWSTRVDRDKAFFSIPDLIDYRKQNRTLEDIAGFANWGANLSGPGGASVEPERVQGVRITSNAFQMLGVQAALGRTLLPEDGQPSSERVAVLSYGLWQRRFGGDAGLAGKKLLLNGDSYTIVGVLPSDFIFPGFSSGTPEAEVAVPLVLETDARRAERGANFIRVFARLKPGVTPQQARADCATITRRNRDLYPLTNAKHTDPRVIPLAEEITGGYRTALWMLLGAVGVVLLVTCSTLANLLLARASARQREMAIRKALGASRGRLARQLLTESTVLACAGGALGLLLAWWGASALVALSPADLPRAAEVARFRPDLRVLCFTLVVSLLAGIAFGLAPALQASSEELAAAIKSAAAPRRRASASRWLVVSEVSCSLVLLICAGLFLKSVVRLQQVSPGIDPRKLLLVRISLPPARYTTRESIQRFYEKLPPRLEALPGVESFGAVSVLPLSGMNTRADFTIVGRPPRTAQEIPAAQTRWVSPGYFHSMRVPLLKGREFTDADGPDSGPVAAISRSIAQRFWPDSNPLGEHLKIDDAGEVAVVAVVGDVKHFSLDEDPLFTIYLPLFQVPANTVSFVANGLNLVVRTRSNPLGAANVVRRELRTVDAEVAASSSRTMDQMLSGAVAPRRFNLELLAVFAAAALVLAASGLYAVISYSVERRTREIGIRMALGASRAQVLWLVVGGGLRLVLTGIALGLGGAMAVTRAMASLLYGVSATDPWTFLAVPVVLLAVAMTACYLPARRATRVDPVTALRSE